LFQFSIVSFRLDSTALRIAKSTQLCILTRKQEPIMSRNDPRIDAYIAESAEFARPVLTHLRKLVHDACPEVEETVKWGFPHFDYKGMMCSMASFKGHCAFGFWKARLIFEVDKKKTEAAMGHFGRITKISDLPTDKVLLGYLKKAVELNDAGIKRPQDEKPKEKKALVIPPYFKAAVKKNKKAGATFENFSHTNKKEYLEWITEAKTEETRERRLRTAIEWMSEGKDRNWKYKRK
jgi:uncharacterized protein YdeI (YjbR/CyaY-like superfamily)